MRTTPESQVISSDRTRMLSVLFGDAAGTYELPLLIAAQALAGLAGAAILALLTQAAGGGGSHGSWLPAVLAAGSLTLFVLAQRYATRKSTAHVQKWVHDVRVRITNKLSNTDLQTFEQIGHDTLLTCLEKDMKVVSGAAAVILSVGQSALFLVLALGYLAYLAPVALLVCVLIIALAVALHFGKMRVIRRDMQDASAAETELFGLVGHLVRGFKELKLHERRRREIRDEVVRTSGDVMRLYRRTFARASDHLIMIQSVFYVLIGAMVFLMPLLGTQQPLLVMKIVAAILFMTGPLTQIVSVLPFFAEAETAARNIAILEQRLSAGADAESPLVCPTSPVLRRIDLQSLRFAYHATDGSSFEVGPIDLTIRRGQVIFVTGGNGSGKSTFLKLLTGLLPALEGTIALNGTPLESGDLVAYRGLFAAIFYDYHLFPALYGIDAPDPAQVGALLERLALSDKTRLVGRAFTPLQLSTGQRKRLAHLVELLEDREVYLFDEWAADQDPLFRRWFYESELPRLKSLGKTVIAVTHDEQYIGLADRWLHFEEGRCTEGTASPGRLAIHPGHSGPLMHFIQEHGR
jgi:putative ATP-binding cassette transporter